MALIIFQIDGSLIILREVATDQWSTSYPTNLFLTRRSIRRRRRRRRLSLKKKEKRKKKRENENEKNRRKKRRRSRLVWFACCIALRFDPSGGHYTRRTLRGYEVILRGQLLKEYAKTRIDMRVGSRSTNLWHFTCRTRSLWIIYQQNWNGTFGTSIIIIFSL